MPQPRIAIKDSQRHVSQKDALWLIACGTHRWALERGGSSRTMIERIAVPDERRAKPSVALEPSSEPMYCGFSRTYFVPPKKPPKRFTMEDLLAAQELRKSLEAGL